MKQNKPIKTGKITGVSLGPGDPELITVKGLQVLKEADKIYFPGSQFKGGRKSSYALSILRHYHLETARLEGFYLKMSLAREEAAALYATTFSHIKNDYEAGLKVAIASEGDASTYSSFSYLLQHFQAAGIPADLIPGITSYALTAAAHNVPLCLQNERVVILPRVRTVTELQESLRHFDVVILMKIRSVMPVILEALKNLPLAVFYGERMGTPQEFISSDPTAIALREVPYFALLIIKKGNPKKDKTEK